MCFADSYFHFYIPKIWNLDINTPIIKLQKSGSVPSHLRSTTLLSSILKFFKRWCAHLTEEDHTISEAPGGFRKGYNCVQRSFILLSSAAKKILFERTCLLKCFITCQRFFVSIRHECVAAQMSRTRIRAHLAHLLSYVRWFWSCGLRERT